MKPRSDDKRLVLAGRVEGPPSAMLKKLIAVAAMTCVPRADWGGWPDGHRWPGEAPVAVEPESNFVG